jgi:hypothetical protein
MADRDEYVTINSVQLALDGAWVVEDTTPLLGQGPFRGQDRVIPGVDGRSFRARVLDAYDVLLPMFVFGRKNQAGTPYGDERLGLKANLAYLRTNLLTGDSKTCTLTFSDASTVSGPVVVNDLMVPGSFDGLRGAVAKCVLDLTLLDGELS